jgi:hypothetical protein
MRSTHVKKKRDSSSHSVLQHFMQHATADRRTTARAIYLPETPYHPPASTCTLSNTRIHLRVVRPRSIDGRTGRERKRRRTSKRNVRLTVVQPRTRTEKCWFLLCGQPPARAACEVFVSPIHSAAPVPGQCPGGGRNPGPASWECRNTACARKGRRYDLL